VRAYRGLPVQGRCAFRELGGYRHTERCSGRRGRHAERRSGVAVGEWVYNPFDVPTHAYTADFALRFWYGSSTTGKDLYDPSGSLLVSRLMYGDLSLYAGEAYTRFELDRRWFLKGYVGGGAFRGANLKDEDFPPVLTPYSATFSVQQNGSPIYADVDVGANVLFGPDFRIGVFGGFQLSQSDGECLRLSSGCFQSVNLRNIPASQPDQGHHPGQ
jgi:hypothetical protein